MVQDYGQEGQSEGSYRNLSTAKERWNYSRDRTAQQSDLVSDCMLEDEESKQGWTNYGPQARSGE